MIKCWSIDCIVTMMAMIGTDSIPLRWFGHHSISSMNASNDDLPLIYHNQFIHSIMNSSFSPYRHTKITITKPSKTRLPIENLRFKKKLSIFSSFFFFFSNIFPVAIKTLNVPPFRHRKAFFYRKLAKRIGWLPFRQQGSIPGPTSSYLWYKKWIIIDDNEKKKKKNRIKEKRASGWSFHLDKRSQIWLSGFSFYSTLIFNFKININ